AGLVEVPRGTVRVSAPPGAAAAWLGPVVEAFLERFPEVNLVLDLSDRFVDLVGEGFDVALRAGELADSGLTSRVLGSMHQRCFASPGWLAAHGVPRHPSELAHVPILVFGPDRSATWVFEGPERVSVDVRGRLAVRHFGLLLAAAERGTGLVRLPVSVAEPSVAAGRLVPVLEAWPGPTARLHLLTAGTSLRTAAVQAFVSLVIERAAGGLERLIELSKEG
ncbi:MAG TPA: substrate binding domain-containing protein, partial [Myxococcota bacterium]|nr:substrate binding domain-containing protein [Myxococcota bacterium]